MNNEFIRVRDVSKNISSQFGINNNQQEDIEKARVKSHTRKTKSGKISTVREYIDSRTKKQEEEFDFVKRNVAGKQEYGVILTEGISRNGNNIEKWGIWGKTKKEVVEKLNKLTTRQMNEIKMNPDNFNVPRGLLSVEMPSRIKKIGKIKKQNVSKKDLVDFGVKAMKEHSNKEMVNEKTSNKKDESNSKKETKQGKNYLQQFLEKRIKTVIKPETFKKVFTEFNKMFSDFNFQQHSAGDVATHLAASFAKEKVDPKEAARVASYLTKDDMFGYQIVYDVISKDLEVGKSYKIDFSNLSYMTNDEKKELVDNGLQLKGNKGKVLDYIYDDNLTGKGFFKINIKDDHYLFPMNSIEKKGDKLVIDYEDWVRQF